MYDTRNAVSNRAACLLLMSKAIRTALRTLMIARRSIWLSRFMQKRSRRVEYFVSLVYSSCTSGQRSLEDANLLISCTSEPDALVALLLTAIIVFIGSLPKLTVSLKGFITECPESSKSDFYDSILLLIPLFYTIRLSCSQFLSDKTDLDTGKFTTSADKTPENLVQMLCQRKVRRKSLSDIYTQVKSSMVNEQKLL